MNLLRASKGLERSRRANWKHGYYSREAKDATALLGPGGGGGATAGGMVKNER
jgi:hypothetical protein